MRMTLIGAAVVAVTCLAVTKNASAQQPHRTLLRDVHTITLASGLHTTGRRSSPVPQTKCVGGSAAHTYTPSTIQCYNRGSDGRDAQWECKADLDGTLRFGETTVVCEGYDHPDDPYILAGSCGVEYTLEHTKEGLDNRNHNPHHRGNGHGYSQHQHQHQHHTSQPQYNQHHHGGTNHYGNSGTSLFAMAFTGFAAYGLGGGNPIVSGFIWMFLLTIGTSGAEAHQQGPGHGYTQGQGNDYYGNTHGHHGHHGHLHGLGLVGSVVQAMFTGLAICVVLGIVQRIIWGSLLGGGKGWHQHQHQPHGYPYTYPGSGGYSSSGGGFWSGLMAGNLVGSLTGSMRGYGYGYPSYSHGYTAYPSSSYGDGWGWGSSGGGGYGGYGGASSSSSASSGTRTASGFGGTRRR